MYVSTHQKDWDKHLPLVLFAYRVAPNASTNESPFYLLYGREPHLPLDASLLLPDSNVSTSVSELRARLVTNLEESRKLIASNTLLAQQRMKQQYDKHATPVPLDVGSKVWVHTPKNRKGLSKKLAHNFHGPYRVFVKSSPVHFKLRTMDNRPVTVPVHANRMKPYYDPSDCPISSPSLDHTTPELSDSDLPPDSFPSSSAPNESLLQDTNTDTRHSDSRVVADVPITRTEDTHEPFEIQPVYSIQAGEA